MPLHPGTSRAVFSENVSEMMHSGHPQDQALAAAYREKRQSRAMGGPAMLGPGLPGAMPMPQAGLGALAGMASPGASNPLLGMGGGGLGALAKRPLGFDDGGDVPDDAPTSLLGGPQASPHTAFLARHGIDTASSDLSPTATGADVKGEALGMVDPLGIPSWAAGKISPELGARLEAIKEASPEGYGAGSIISPINDIPASIVSKGAGLAGRGIAAAAKAAPATTTGIGTAGLLAASAHAAGEGEAPPAGAGEVSEDDPELQARLKTLGPKPMLTKEQDEAINKLKGQVVQETALQAAAAKKVKPYGKEEEADHLKRIAADPQVVVHGNNIADLRDQIKKIGGQVLQDQQAWTTHASTIRTNYANELAEQQKAGQPLSVREPGAVLAARAGGLGLSGILGAVGGWKHLPFWRGPLTGAGFGALGAAAPTAYDIMQPENTQAYKLAEHNLTDPNWYKRVGVDATIGGLEGALLHEAGHIMGSPSRRKAPTTPEAPPAAPTPGIGAAGTPSPAAAASTPGVAAAARQPRPQKQWADDLKDVQWDRRSDGIPYEVGTGHPLPRHLRDQIPATPSTVTGALEPAEADGGGIEGRAMGGPPPMPFYARSEARDLGHIGPVIGSTMGRGDSKSISVPGGSYVLPASHVSALGQGNTLAGHSILNQMFSGGPLGTSLPRGGHGAGPPRPPRGGSTGPFAAGGTPKDHGQAVPIMISDGEHVLSPEQVMEIDRQFGGKGDIDSGHKLLDAWVLHERNKHIKELKKLPGPAK